MQTLLNLTGGWPILMPREEWEMENYTWQEVDDVYTQLLSLSCFFKIVATRDEQNSTRNILMVFFYLYYTHIIYCPIYFYLYFIYLDMLSI